MAGVSVYFVRHAQPDFSWQDDRTRPLTPGGARDCARVAQALRGIPIGRFVSSPYRRSMDTIRGAALERGMELDLDERLRERGKGREGNTDGLFRRRWADFAFREPGGESLGAVQERNKAALAEILARAAQEKTAAVAVGTHGTALSTILNLYDPSFGCDDFLRIIDFMPYIVRLDFENGACVGKRELLIVEKTFKGGANR